MLGTARGDAVERLDALLLRACQSEIARRGRASGNARDEASDDLATQPPTTRRWRSSGATHGKRASFRSSPLAGRGSHWLRPLMALASPVVVVGGPATTSAPSI
jgi:hypothetical protein